MSYFPLTNTGGVARNPEVDYENAILESWGMSPGKTFDDVGASALDDGPALHSDVVIPGVNISQIQYEPIRIQSE